MENPRPIPSVVMNQRRHPSEAMDAESIVYALIFAIEQRSATVARTQDSLNEARERADSAQKTVQSMAREIKRLDDLVHGLEADKRKLRELGSSLINGIVNANALGSLPESVALQMDAFRGAIEDDLPF